MRRTESTRIGLPRFPWATVPDVLRHQAARHPTAAALIATSGGGREVELTWQELCDDATRIANVLVGVGVEPGSRIGLLLTGRCGVEQHAIYHGVHAAGCINVPLNPRYTLQELLKVLEIADCRVLFVEGGVLPIVEELREHGPDMLVVSVDGSLSTDLRSLMARASATPCGRVVGPDDECDWVFTSGTTATPKAAAFTQRAAVACGILVAKTWELVPSDVYQSSAPFFTSTGSHTNLLGALVAGATYYLESAPSPREWASRVAAHGSTCTFLSSSVLKLVSDEGGLPDGTTMRRIVYGGQVMPDEAHLRFNEEFTARHGIGLLHLAGCTEGGPTGVYCPPSYHATHPGSIGDRGFAPWTVFDVLGEDGVPVGEGEVGELWYAAPSVMSRYVGQPEATAATLRDGGVLTGDLVRVGESGFLWFVDRKKDIIRRGGLNIASAEVEAVLALHPGVLEAAAVPKPHDVYGEEVRAVVVLRDGATVSGEELIGFCGEHLASHKVPVELEFVRALPRNAMGKVVKSVLRGEDYGITQPAGQ